MSTYIVFSCDWESKGNYKAHHLIGDRDYFEEVSRGIIAYSKDFLGGRMVWYCKIDFYADITYYNGFDKMARDIIDNGGELGIHIHHISKDAAQRRKVYKWAFEKIKLAGYPVTAYSAGMGEYYDFDTGLLYDSGYRTQRGAFPLFKHNMCDWLDADLWPGYVNESDYKKVDDHGRLFTYSLGGENEGDKPLILHIREGISLDDLKYIYDKHIGSLIRAHRFPCIGCLFHPYDLVIRESPDVLSGKQIEKWQKFTIWLSNNDVLFITDKEAKRLYLNA